MPELMPIFMETLSEGYKQLLVKCGFARQVLRLHGQHGCLARQVAPSLSVRLRVAVHLFLCLALSDTLSVHVSLTVYLCLVVQSLQVTRMCGRVCVWGWPSSSMPPRRIVECSCCGFSGFVRDECKGKPSYAGVAHDVFGAAYPRDSTSPD